MAKYFLIVLLFFSTNVSAGIYTWVDKNGAVHIADTPPPDSIKGGQVKQIETGEAEKAPATSETGSQAPTKRIFLDKLYTDDSIAAETTRLESRITYYRGACKTEKRNPPRTQEWWDNYCEDDANRIQKSLDVLTSDPDRYFYVMDQLSRKARGDQVDNPPYYRYWH